MLRPAAPAPQVLPPESPWDRHARQWHRIAPPLRPGPQDLAAFQALMDESVVPPATGRPLRVLMLGVTAELAALHHPAPAVLVAVDASMGMLRLQWRAPPCPALRVLGRWEELPLRDGSVDVVLADGSFCALPGVPTIEQVLHRVAAAMAPGGVLLARMFERPQPAEPLHDVLAAIRAGTVGSVHVAKWRVAMALHGDLTQGVMLDTVWQAFASLAPSLPALAALTGWPLDSVETLSAYEGVTGRYYFPTHAETRALFETRFEVLACRRPGYELGARCPTWALRRR